MNRNWTLCPLCLEKVDDDGSGEPWNHTCATSPAMTDPIDHVEPRGITHVLNIQAEDAAAAIRARGDSK